MGEVRSNAPHFASSAFVARRVTVSPLMPSLAVGLEGNGQLSAACSRMKSPVPLRLLDLRTDDWRTPPTCGYPVLPCPHCGDAAPPPDVLACGATANSSESRPTALAECNDGLRPEADSRLEGLLLQHHYVRDGH